MTDTLMPQEQDMLERLYREFAPRMFDIAYSILKNRHESEDAVSEAFVKIAKNLSKLENRPYKELQGFCAVVTMNTARDRCKHNRRHDALFSELNEQISEAREALEFYEMSDLKVAISRLEEQQRETLLLYYFYGLSAKDIAKIQSIAKITVYKRIESALKALRKSLEKGDEL